MQNNKYSKLIQQLKKDRQEAMESATELITGDMRESIAELSVVDNHPADIATEVYERSRDMAIHDRLRHRIHAIDSALERYEEGNYGICERCLQEIPYERLEVLPYTTVCTKCSREEEMEEQHSLHRDPVENEILNRPFSRTFNDGTDRVEFDGEDSWQAVARVRGPVKEVRVDRGPAEGLGDRDEGRVRRAPGKWRTTDVQAAQEIHVVRVRGEVA
jgi:YteA family regulatory protein